MSPGKRYSMVQKNKMLRLRHKTLPYIGKKAEVSQSGASKFLAREGFSRSAQLTKIRIRKKQLVVRAVRNTKATHAQVAKKFGISTRQVRRIVKEFDVERKHTVAKKQRKKGEKRLTTEQKKEIRKLRQKQGLSEGKLAVLFGISQPAIHYILKH